MTWIRVAHPQMKIAGLQEYGDRPRKGESWQHKKQGGGNAGSASEKPH